MKCENVVKELQLMVRGSGCVEASNYSIERGTFCSGVYGQNIGRGERVGTLKSGLMLWDTVVDLTLNTVKHVVGKRR